jgi:hypothetical protein
MFDDQLISRAEWFRKGPEDVESTPPIHMALDCLYLEVRLAHFTRLRAPGALETIREDDHARQWPTEVSLGVACPSDRLTCVPGSKVEL